MPRNLDWILGLALAVAAGAHTLAAGPGVQAQEEDHHAFTLDVEALPCPAGYENGIDDDGYCLGYDGSIPGPTIVAQAGDTFSVTLRNHVWDSLQAQGASPDQRETLLRDNVSLHRHGVATPQSDDGVPGLPKTDLEDSTVAPNGSFTYEFSTPFPGAWHYHDHVFGDFMAEGQHRGLYGTLLVLPEDETTSAAVDLHLTDEGPHGGAGDALVRNDTVPAGERFDLVATALGNYWWTVTLEDPGGEVVWRHDHIGPGVSRSVTVAEAEPGTYTWTAQTPFIRGQFTGEVVAE